MFNFGQKPVQFSAKIASDLKQRNSKKEYGQNSGTC
jgi:hypothetical protein